MPYLCKSCTAEIQSQAPYRKDTYKFCSKECFEEYIKEKSQKDNINPEHYKVGGIETFDFIKAKLSPSQLIGFCKGNILKYISRADHKNKLEDLKKAEWYLNRLIIELEK